MLPLLLVVLLVGHLALPFADATTTSARSGPDFQVNEILFDGAGSVFTSSGLVLAPDTHTVRIDVSNAGSSSGNAFLSLVHKGSPNAAEQVVNTVDLGVMAANSGPTTYLMSWSATTGPSQTLFARISGANDGNIANNEYRRDFDVERLLDWSLRPQKPFLSLPLEVQAPSWIVSRTNSMSQSLMTELCRSLLVCRLC